MRLHSRMAPDANGPASSLMSTVSTLQAPRAASKRCRVARRMGRRVKRAEAQGEEAAAAEGAAPSWAFVAATAAARARRQSARPASADAGGVDEKGAPGAWTGGRRPDRAARSVRAAWRRARAAGAPAAASRRATDADRAAVRSARVVVVGAPGVAPSSRGAARGRAAPLCSSDAPARPVWPSSSARAPPWAAAPGIWGVVRATRKESRPQKQCSSVGRGAAARSCCALIHEKAKARSHGPPLRLPHHHLQPGGAAVPGEFERPCMHAHACTVPSRRGGRETQTHTARQKNSAAIDHAPLTLSLPSLPSLPQVEYAMEAISNAGAAVGVLARDGVVLAAEKRITSKVRGRWEERRRERGAGRAFQWGWRGSWVRARWPRPPCRGSGMPQRSAHAAPTQPGDWAW